MPAFPSWIEPLRDDTARAAALGLRWLTDEQRKTTLDAWRSTWNQVPFSETVQAVNGARLERSVPLFVGPTRTRRLGKAESQLVVTHDPAEPNLVWLSLSFAAPPTTWAVGGESVEELERALAAYTPGEPPTFDRHERIVKAMDLQAQGDWAAITSSLEALEPWLDDASWGSAYDQDPWASVPPDAGSLVLSQALRRAHEQHPGRAPSLSYRTLWSRSVLRIEQHPFNLWVFDMSYRAASDRRVVEANGGREPGARLPADLPVDLLASLLRGESFTPEAFQRVPLEELTPFDASCIAALAPTASSTLATLRRLVRTWASREEQMLGLLDVLFAFGFQSLLFEAAATTTISTVREEVLRAIDPGAQAEVQP